MRIETNLTMEKLQSLAHDLGMEIVEDNTIQPNRKPENAHRPYIHTFKLRVRPGIKHYISMNPLTGRRVGNHIPCWHGYRDFMADLYEYDTTAKIVSGSMGMPTQTYTSRQDFDNSHDNSRYIEMGSYMYPFQYIDKCCHA